jgi:hypothetical protein
MLNTIGAQVRATILADSRHISPYIKRLPPLGGQAIEGDGNAIEDLGFGDGFPDSHEDHLPIFPPSKWSAAAATGT